MLEPYPVASALAAFTFGLVLHGRAQGDLFVNYRDFTIGPGKRKAIINFFRFMSEYKRNPAIDRTVYYSSKVLSEARILLN